MGFELCVAFRVFFCVVVRAESMILNVATEIMFRGKINQLVIGGKKKIPGIVRNFYII